ncbi:hydrogenase maturation protease [Thermochromatium tepidum]|uniref:Hydrogenase maturation protease n=1 Tax=Thermochromatium tepidum ATCC 43061 TaxID=316276 RepID=A0A6I6EFW4_THETI|nr:hydrogenase maturation protease [Thermochromatium tepidum]QGU33100.1 hydrogenase maturation protease [Thermochromatium tepidum ATCC 43061]
MRKTLIIGYGNPIRGDDVIGPLAVERLVERGLPNDVEAIACHALTIELAAELADCERAIFIDAATGGKPGQVQIRLLVPAADPHSMLVHTLDPSGLLAWCRHLYGRAPEAYLLTLTGSYFGYADGELSPVVAAALGCLIDQVARLCESPGLGPSRASPVQDKS